MEQEASMVGLGWNIGIGSIQRNLKGVPDDFNGEKLSHIRDRKNNTTVKVTGTIGGELAPLDGTISAALALNADVSAMYNSYKGPGAIFGFGAQLSFGAGNAMISPNFNTAFSSFDGIDYSLGIQLADSRLPVAQAGLSLGFNTLTGTKTYNASVNGTEILPNPTTFFPGLSTERTSTSLSLKFKGGAEVYTIEPFVGAGGSFHQEKLRYKNIWRQSPMYGSMYLGEGQNEDRAILDFSRTQDKALFSGNINLPAPISGEDYYTVSGHGMNGTFKLFRNDIGLFGDQSFFTPSGGGSVGAEVAFGNLVRVGADLTVNLITEANNFRNVPAYDNADLRFKTKQETGNDEPYYFDFLYGGCGHIMENSASNPIHRDYRNWGSDEPLKFGLGSRITPTLRKKSGGTLSISNQLLNSREPRGRHIRPILNSEISYTDSVGQKVIIPELNLNIYESSNNSTTIQPNLSKTTYQRKQNDQIGAFMMTDEQGMRWHYGLPVLNTFQQEATFSYKGVGDEVNSCNKIVHDYINNINSACGERSIDHETGQQGNEDYLDIRQMPDYAHSHLLTSMVSHDYIDYDPSDGQPNSNDYGHWVRFEYVRTNDEGDPYQWRNPYNGAYFNGGLNTLDDDNKAFFTYGEREQYYPYRIYTATHYAQFYYSQREDARGASCSLPDVDEYGAYSYKLDKVELYRYGSSVSSNENVKNLIKTVIFKYDNPNGANELCTGLLNHESSGGKLTLHQVEINSYKSVRGSLTPYTFTYNSDGYSQKSYNQFYADRWGIYRDPGNNACLNTFAPFTEQSHAGGQGVLDSIQAENAKSWHLSSIRMPSGSEIKIDVGRDHYAHVQNKVATQMTKICGFAQASNDTIPISTNATSNDFKIFFDLNNPIDESESQIKKEFFTISIF